MFISSLTDKGREEGGNDAEAGANTGPEEAMSTRKHNQHEWWIVRIILNSDVFQDVSHPKSFRVPLFSITLAVTYAARLTGGQQVPLSGTSTFFESCPTGSGRTQAGSFIKLLAASVTTIGIHGHLGSLTGSESWGRELCRALEVLLLPLTPVFTFASSIWYEIASVPSFRRGPWDERLGIRYRLARMCSVRMDSDSPSTCLLRPNQYLAVVNPRHLKPVLLRRDLKWFGRVLLLVILFAQYVQAAILLTRRYISGTTAMVDFAMILMVASGLVALPQSIVISLINMSWTLHPDFEPCLAEACCFTECSTLRKDAGLPTTDFQVIVFGRVINGIPRAILHQIFAGYLQTNLTLKSNQPLWRNAIAVFGLQCLWQGFFKKLIFLDLLLKLYGYSTSSIPTNTDPAQGLEPPVNMDVQHPDVSMIPDALHLGMNLEPSTSNITNVAANTDLQPVDVPPGPIPTTLATDKPSIQTSIVSMIASILPHVGLCTVGLLCIAFALASVVLQLFYIFSPSIAAYLRIVSETSLWKHLDVTSPCPQLWKDGLEDELWWF